jgi:hypothetical protein
MIAFYKVKYFLYPIRALWLKINFIYFCNAILYLRIISMKISLLQNGKTTDKSISAIVDLYANRIKKYSGFEIITLPELKNTKNMPIQEQKNKEATKIIQSVTDDDYIILLDERGKELNTLEFSGKVVFPSKKKNRIHYWWSLGLLR